MVKASELLTHWLLIITISSSSSTKVFYVLLWMRTYFCIAGKICTLSLCQKYAWTEWEVSKEDFLVSSENLVAWQDDFFFFRGLLIRDSRPEHCWKLPVFSNYIKIKKKNGCSKVFLTWWRHFKFCDVVLELPKAKYFQIIFLKIDPSGR